MVDFELASINAFNDKRSNISLEVYNEKLYKLLKKDDNVRILINKIEDEEAACSLKYIRVENETLKHRAMNTKDVERDSIFKRKIEFFQKKINIFGKLSNCIYTNDGRFQ
jgi:hypothetical protein